MRSARTCSTAVLVRQVTRLTIATKPATGRPREAHLLALLALDLVRVLAYRSLWQVLIPGATATFAVAWSYLLVEECFGAD